MSLVSVYIVQWLKENDFVLLALCQNGASGVAKGSSWFSYHKSQHGFTMLTHIILLVFGLSINIPLMIPNSW